MKTGDRAQKQEHHGENRGGLEKSVQPGSYEVARDDTRRENENDRSALSQSAGPTCRLLIRTDSCFLFFGRFSAQLPTSRSGPSFRPSEREMEGASFRSRPRLDAGGVRLGPSGTITPLAEKVIKVIDRPLESFRERNSW